MKPAYGEAAIVLKTEAVSVEQCNRNIREYM